ncbi:hypothetical protein [Flaviaesturariibacter terrae]
MISAEAERKNRDIHRNSPKKFRKKLTAQVRKPAGGQQAQRKDGTATQRNRSNAHGTQSISFLSGKTTRGGPKKSGDS